MQPLLYAELVPFYPLLDPLEDHADEGEELGAILRGAVAGPRRLLELGSGAGHGAHYLAPGFEATTLSDLSAPMLARSRTLNPGCEHVLGDMRSLRLGREFDCVLIHDAIAYLQTPAELLATAETAFAHLRPGGAALLVPDCTKESFVECHEDHAGDDDERSLRGISWSHDPDPHDDTHVTDFALLLREGGQVRAVHERHVFGLFSTMTWIEQCRAAGFVVEVLRRPLAPEYLGSAYTEQMLLCRKPA